MYTLFTFLFSIFIVFISINIFQHLAYMSARPTILYFSMKCQLCVGVLNALKAMNMLNAIVKICIDDQRIRVPPQIKVVPTLVISSTGQILVGQNIFVWLQNLRNARIQYQQEVSRQNPQNDNQQRQPIQQQSQQSQQSQQQPNIPARSKNPNGFVSSEMSGLSDMYAYTNIDYAPQHSYQLCSDIDKNTIFTAPEERNKISAANDELVMKLASNRRNDQDEEAKKMLDPKNVRREDLEKMHQTTDILLKNVVERQQNALMSMYDKI